MMPQLQLKPKQRQAAVLALACFTSALCFQGLLSAPKSWDFATKIDNDVMTIQDAGELQMHRYLLKTLDEKHLMEAEEEGRKLILDPNEGDEGAASPIGTQKLSRYLSELSSYTLEDAMAEADMFKYGFAVLVYDPPNDTFWTYYPKQLKMKASYLKIAASARYLSFMLRRAFPERFTPSSDEFAVSFSSGDYPTVDVSQLPHAGTAPVLHFSSVFRVRISDYFPMDYLRESELKHGRIAQLAIVGYICVDQGIVVHPLGQGLSSAAAHNVMVENGVMGNMLVFIGLFEIVSWLAISEMLQGSGREPGFYGWGMQYLEGKTEKEIEWLKYQEIMNGRLAMMAFGGAVTQSVLYDVGFPYLN